MKVALLQVAELTDPRFVYHILEKGFDFVFYQSFLDGGGTTSRIDVIQKGAGSLEISRGLFSLLGNKTDEGDYVVFWGKAKDDRLIGFVEAIFFDNGVAVSNLDIFNANSIKDIDEVISQAGH